MSGIHQFSGSFRQSGSSARFKSGVELTGSFTGSQLTGKYQGDGSQITGISATANTIQLFIGSASNVPPTFSQWVTGSGGTHEILLSTSSSNGQFNHFAFMKLTENGWEERSQYFGSAQNGLISSNSLTETLGTGIHRYLLIAMSTASKETVTKGATVIINPIDL